MKYLKSLFIFLIRNRVIIMYRFANPDRRFANPGRRFANPGHRFTNSVGFLPEGYEDHGSILFWGRMVQAAEEKGIYEVDYEDLDHYQEAVERSWEARPAPVCIHCAQGGCVCYQAPPPVCIHCAQGGCVCYQAPPPTPMTKFALLALLILVALLSFVMGYLFRMLGF
jgi:hypothetical protein